MNDIEEDDDHVKFWAANRIADHLGAPEDLFKRALRLTTGANLAQLIALAKAEQVRRAARQAKGGAS